MKKLALVAGAVALVGMSSVATADGNRRGPAYSPVGYSWSGIYFGGHVGGGWGDSDITETLSIAVGGVPLITATQNHDTSGWLAGVQLGAMKQFGNFVIGAELSLSGADINGSGNDYFGITTLTGGVVGSTCESTVNWMATGLARAGLAWDRVLVYGTVGYAIAGVDHSVRIDIPVGPGVQLNWAQQDVAHGIAFGGGVEFAVSRDVTLGVQYLRANLESDGEGMFVGGAITTGKRDLDIDTVTGRLNIKLGGDCCAAAPLK
jgi:outer membrane immunogenic protein